MAKMMVFVMLVLAAVVQAQNNPPPDPFPPLDPSLLGPSPPLDPSLLGPSPPLDPSQPVGPTPPINPSPPVNPTPPNKPSPPVSPTPPINPSPPVNPLPPIIPSPPQTTCPDNCVSKCSKFVFPILKKLCNKGCMLKCKIIGSEYLYNCVNSCAQTMPNSLSSDHEKMESYVNSCYRKCTKSY